MTAEYDDHLRAYIGRQRWFGGKGRSFHVTGIHRLAWLSDPKTWPAVRVELIELGYHDAESADADTYQVPVAYYRDQQDRLDHAYIGHLEDADLGSVHAYDALQDREATGWWLRGIKQGRTADGMNFSLLASSEELTEAASLVVSAEQSNTSLVFGEETLLKVFRKVAAGRNPDIEIHQALTLHGCDKVAPLLGWVSATWTSPAGDPVTADLAMLQRFLRTATDGWDLALTSVRDLFAEGDLHADEVGGDFAGEAFRLGATTGEIHGLLARLFPTASWDRRRLRSVADTMRARLDAAVTVVPELAAFKDQLRQVFAAVTTLADPVPVQRVHGDLHLGQTMRTVLGWKLIDFEGEPAKRLMTRLELDSPLRDVAGMLRSFVYAPRALVRDHAGEAQIAFRATEWSDRNRTAFLDGYTEATGVNPRSQAALLRAYELDKAVYETVYEARNRPTWLQIPLESIQRALANSDPEFPA